MNRISKSLLFCILPLSVAFAQEEPPDTNAPTSNLKISVGYAKRMRISVLTKAAETYAAEQNLPAALDAYERILEINPEHQETRYTLSTIYLGAKKYQKAEVLLLELIEENPEDFELWNNLAWLYATAEDLSIRDGQKAIKFAHEAMTLAPNNYHVWSTLSEAYYVSGEYEKAHRAILHMASLVEHSGINVTEESLENYNKQLRKCKRAMDAAEAMADDK